ncbi:unnamed protein product [Prorocentrum cordatum]|uniref:Uncharacterized protein n=1 Tax=Prorocentrum cordatum TaxID=2364126 RepID=A0ABN9Q3F1_9DINO|nr:unnamed protein product [Polarella glacialis]
MSLKRYPEEVRRFESWRERPGEDSRGRDAARLEVFRPCGHSFTQDRDGQGHRGAVLPARPDRDRGGGGGRWPDVPREGRDHDGGGWREAGAGARRRVDLRGVRHARLDEERRAATVRATTLCVTMEIPRVGFLAALDRHPGERQHFEKLATQKGNVGVQTWPIFEGMPRHLLYLVNLYAESGGSPSSGSGRRSVVRACEGTPRFWCCRARSPPRQRVGPASTRTGTASTSRC